MSPTDPQLPPVQPPPPTEARSGLIVVGRGQTALEVARRVHKMVQSMTLICDGREELPEELEDVKLISGDACSRLVLEQAGVAHVAGLLACTADDTFNMEVSRLAVEAGVPHVICRLTTPDLSDEVLALGARPVAQSGALAAAMAALLPGVVATTSQVGLGQGEILQVRVMPGSLVVGRTIATIATRAFLIAAIYRDGHLVVPHGDTRIRAGDQVLLIGEPETLAAVADYFRLGGARFPGQFGRAIVAWDRSNHELVVDEARQLVRHARKMGFVRITEPHSPQLEPGRPEPQPLLLGAGPLPDRTTLGAAVWVLDPPSARGFATRRTSRLRTLLRATQSPVLLARGSAPYRRLLVPMSDSGTAWRGLELAVDIARLMQAEVTALHVKQPAFLGGASGEETASQAIETVEQIARLYNLKVHVQVAEGNPIKCAARVAEDHQLVVVAHRPGQRDTYFNPDVGLRIALTVPCSALLLPVSARAAAVATGNS